MDCLLKDYKNTKQILLKKLKNKENFWKEKEKFIKNYKIEGCNKIFTSIPSFNNITNVITSIPNPINTNIKNITNFAGTLGSTLKNTIYNQLSIDTHIKKPNAENKQKEESKTTIDFYCVKFFLFYRVYSKKILDNFKAINRDSLKNNEDKHSKDKLDSITRILEMKNTNKAKPININDKNIKAEDISAEKSSQSFNPYEESSQTLSLLKKEDYTDLDRTRKILFELSDLMTNFSFKVQQHHEMTQQSKYFSVFYFKTFLK